MEQQDSKNDLRNNLAFVVAGAVLMALVIIAVSFAVYYRSPTRQILDQLQANQKESTSKTTIEKFKSTGPVTEPEVDTLVSSTQEEISSRNTDADYSSEALTDAVLGL